MSPTRSRLRPRRRLPLRSAVAAAAGALMCVTLAPGSASAAAPHRPAPVHYTAVDLGTLGGATSVPVAMSGPVVVGSARTADGYSHAFAYDARTGAMTDLGSLAGPAGTSSAQGIADGRWVVGVSSMPGLPYPYTHAFVYDLRTRALTDLGANGGYSAWVTSVSGHLVTGGFLPDSAPTKPGRGFVYDLRIRTRTDLGQQMVYGVRAAGHTAVATDGRLAYAYDLRSGRRVGFGPADAISHITGMNGSYAIGDTTPPGPNAMVYQVDGRRFTSLPSLGGPFSTAVTSDRHGDVVGTAATGESHNPGDVADAHATVWVRGRT